MPSVAPPPSRPPPDDPEGARDVEETPPRFIRFGTAAGLAVVASVLAAVPAALRVAGALPDGPSMPRVLVAIAGAFLLPMIVAIAILRGARVGLRAFGGAEASARGMGLIAWFVVGFIVLAAFGAALRATTHHHPLAGVTFAIVGGVAALGLSLVSLRVAQIVAKRSPITRTALFAVSLVVFFVVLIVAGMRFAGAASGAAPPPGRAMLVDVLAFALAALFASRRSLAGVRIIAIIGPPLAATLLVFAISTVRGSSALCDAAVERAPVVAPLVSPLRR